MNHIVKHTVLMGALLLLTSCKSQNKSDVQENTKRPNIVFILTDDQYRKEFNFLTEGQNKDGSPKNLTPHLDKLSHEGVILGGLHCPSPICVPSRFTYLTGLYASRATNQWMQDLHRVHQHTFVAQEPEITTETPTFAKQLKALGYTTGFIGKNHSVEERNWTKLPADADVTTKSSKDFLIKKHTLVQEAIKKVGFDYADRIYHTNPRAHGPLEISQHNLEWLTEGALDFIDKNADKLFYLYYSVTVPHGPENGWKTDPRSTPKGILDKIPDIGTSRSTILERLKANNIDSNRADMLWLDDNIGVLLKKLEEEKILDNTIIVYLTDHGMESGKTTVYQGGLKTEGFIWAKHLQGHQNIKSLISTVDLVPTLMEMVGGKPENYAYDGVSLLPVIKGEKTKVRETVYAEMGQSRAVIKGKYKYIALRYSDYTKNMPMKERQTWHNAMVKYMKAINRPPFDNDVKNGKFGHSGQIPGGWDNEWAAMEKYPAYFDADQLYDLDVDPNEQNNLAYFTDYQGILRDMKFELKGYLEKLPGGLTEFKEDEFRDFPKDSILKRAARLRKDVFH